MLSRLLSLYVLAFTIFCLFMFSATGWCSLNSSVQKYKNSEVNQAELRELARYDHLIRYFSNFAYFVPKHKVSPDFVRALILAESGANSKAVSKKEALGLGQIILPTGRQAAKELSKSRTRFKYVSMSKLSNLVRTDLFDPATNILLTCYLIAKYNHKFNGRIELVVSAWNAGEYTKSLSYGKHAPYRETENLIGKVNAYYIYLLKNRIFP